MTSFSRDLAVLSSVLSGPAKLHGRARGVRVRGITADSRKVRGGFVFVCLKGARHDGHAFVPKAVRDGAVAVVAEFPLRHTTKKSSIPVIQVRSSRRALAELSAAFWGYPSRGMDVVGITGTNGKTTTAYMLESILQTAGVRTALFGTVEYRFGGREFSHAHTTDEAPDLQRMFREVREMGCGAVVMEASSEGIAQQRVVGTQFRAAVFTNLTRDHLNFHGTMRRYFEAKASLFEGLPARELGGVAAVNVGSRWGAELIRRTRAKVVRYGMGAGPEVAASSVQASVSGTSFVMRAGSNGVGVPVKLALLGEHNVENALAAVAVAQGLGVEESAIIRGLKRVVRVPGRLERVWIKAPFVALVDYAHTPDALERVIRAVRRFCRRQVITVIGCGGNRDRGKRPLMGRIAAEVSHFAFITSDNPRNEDPDEIIRDMVGGIRRPGRHAVEPDRRKAISGALARARRGDVVLVAGKGHERTQTAGGKSFPFDDVKVVREEWSRLI